MPFCVNCGCEITEHEGRVCEACQAGKESAGAAEVAIQPSINYFLNLFKGLLLNPEKTMKSSSTYSNIIPGLVTALVSFILLDAICIIYIKQVVNGLGNAFGLFGELFFYRGFDISYAQIYFKIFLALVIQLGLLSATTILVMKIFKNKITFTQALNIVGLAQFYILLAGIIMIVLGAIHPYLGVSIYIVGILTSCFSIDYGIKPFIIREQPSSMYLFPSIVLVFLVFNGIIMKLI